MASSCQNACDDSISLERSNDHEMLRDSPLMKLPECLWVKIFSYLPLKDRGKALQTSKWFCAIADKAWHTVNNLALRSVNWEIKNSETVWSRFGLKPRKMDPLTHGRPRWPAEIHLKEIRKQIREKRQCIINFLLPKIGDYLHYLELQGQDDYQVSMKPRMLRPITSACSNLKSLAVYKEWCSFEVIGRLAKFSMLEELYLSIDITPTLNYAEMWDETFAQLFAKLGQLKILRLNIGQGNDGSIRLRKCLLTISSSITHVSVGCNFRLEADLLVQFLQQSPNLIFYDLEEYVPAALELLALHAPQLETIKLDVVKPSDIPESQQFRNFRCLKSLELDMCSSYGDDFVVVKDLGNSIMAAFPVGVVKLYRYGVRLSAYGCKSSA